MTMDDAINKAIAGWTPERIAGMVRLAKQQSDRLEKQQQCTWKQADTEHMPDTWQADCGAMWTFTDGGPQDNDMNFCPKCGKELIEKQDE